MEQVALVIGESLVDVVHDRDGSSAERPGGSAANVAVALSRLERPVWFATSYADDRLGAVVSRHLRDAGIELATDPHVVDRTSVAEARIGPDGAATYEFDVDWRLAETLTVPDDVTVTAVHVCSFSAVLPPGADGVLSVVQEWRDRASISYDVNVRPDLTGTGAHVVSRVEQLVALADVVKASDEDVAALYPGEPEAAVVTRWLATGPAVVIVTRGADGATAFAGRGSVDVAAVDRGLVDTIGAGDTFSAAIIDALWERGLLGAESRDRLRSLDLDVWRAVLGHAAAAAAVTVSRPGADPPRRGELSS